MHTLPAIDDLQVQCLVNEADNIKAYLLYLDYEKEHTTVADQRCVRILGFLLLNAPNQDVRMEVTKCILSCKDGRDLVNFGSFFERYVILPCELSLPFSLPGCQVNVSSFLSSQEVQRSNARFQRALVKRFLGGCEGSGESRYSRGPQELQGCQRSCQ